MGLKFIGQYWAHFGQSIAFHPNPWKWMTECKNKKKTNKAKRKKKQTKKLKRTEEFYPKFVFVTSSDTLMFCFSLPGARVGQDVLFICNPIWSDSACHKKNNNNHLFSENLFETRSCCLKVTVLLSLFIVFAFLLWLWWTCSFFLAFLAPVHLLSAGG